MNPGDLVKIRKPDVIIWDLNDETNPVMVEDTRTNQVVIILGGPPEHLPEHVKTDIVAYVKILTTSGVTGWIHSDHISVVSPTTKQV